VNASPTASAGGPYVLAEGGNLTLTATASDPEGDAVTFSWDVNGDGIFGDATGAHPTLTWTQLKALGFNETTSISNLRGRVSDGFSTTTSAPATLAVREALAVASFFDSAIYFVDASTGAVLQTLVSPNSQATLLGPAGITLGPDGNLYLSSQFNNSIVKYD